MRALHDGIPERGAGDAVILAERNCHQFLRILGDGILITWVGVGFQQRQGCDRATAFRANRVPLAFCELRRFTIDRKHFTVFRTTIPAFAVHKLRTGDDNFFHRQLLFDDQLVQQRRADTVDVEEMRKIRQQILVGRQMNNAINAAQRFRPVVPVAHVTDDAFGVRRHPVRPCAVAGMHRRREIIEQPDPVTSL